MVVVHAYTDYRRLVDAELRAERQLAEIKSIKEGRFRTISGTPATQTQQSQTQSQ